MGKTAIEWTEQTWNPVTGCSKVSPGCAKCYAERTSHRWGWTTQPWTTAHAAENIVLHPERLDQPLKVKKPTTWFVNSMSDLFHEAVDDDFIADVFAVMALTPRHTYQVLTKRPQRMHKLLGTPTMSGEPFYAAAIDAWTERTNFDIPTPLPNVWQGTSIENRRMLWRADELRRTPAAVRFLSCEPLLADLGELNLDGIHWVIVGGESGPNARPMSLDWVRSIRDQCQMAGVAFFYKQAGGVRPGGPAVLDGREWREMPEVKAA